MPRTDDDKPVTIYCISRCKDGEGGYHEPGDEVRIDPKREPSRVGRLLATGRFSEEKEAGERAKKGKGPRKGASSASSGGGSK